MPYKSEPTSATGHIDILKDPVIREFMARVRTHEDPARLELDIRRRILDVSHLVGDIASGVIFASDASSYESIAREDFPSVRIGMLKFSNVLIAVDDYMRLRDSADLFVDPVQVAQIKRASQSMSIALPGAGISSESERRTKAFFRETVFDIFRAERFVTQGNTLFSTLVHLLRKMGSVKVVGGVEGISFMEKKKSPIDGSPLPPDIHVPLDPGYLDLGPGQRIYLTDALRVQDVFSPEGSNIECFNRLMSALEHILLIHLMHCSHQADRSVTGNMNVIVDGPLAVFGEAARFHKGIMAVLHDIRTECRAQRMPGPLVMGVSKTGKVVEHAKLIDALLQTEADGVTRREGTFILPVDDTYRYEVVQPSLEPETGDDANFGKDTYYGQTMIVRTARRKVFDVTLAYPFARKAEVNGVPFREAKMDLDNYGDDLSRMLSLVETMQTDLFENALIPVHLAHRYASIAHSPAGKTLDAFVREALKASGAKL